MLKDYREPRDWKRIWRDPPGFFAFGCCCGTSPTYYGNSCQNIAHYIGVAGGAGNLGKGCITYQPDTWTTQATYTGSALNNQAYWSVSPAVYSSGGNTGTAHAKWDSSTNTWTDLHAMPSGRTSLPAGAALLNSVTFGFVITGATVTVATLKYDILGDSWSSHATNPSAVDNSATAVINNLAYINGGLNGSGTVLSSMYSYDGTADSFATKTSSSSAVWVHGAFSLTPDNAAIFGCGENSSSVVISAVNEYTVDTWTGVTAFPFGAVSTPRGAQIGTSGYFGGGSDGSSVAQKEWYGYVLDTWAAKTNETVNCSDNGCSCY